MTLGDRLAAIGLIVAVVGIAVGIAEPEIRCRVHLNHCDKTILLSGGHLNEWRPGKSWTGPITNLVASGTNQWRGIWDNSQNQHHTLVISINPETKTAEISEIESKQTWIGPYTEDSSKISVNGKEASGAYDFESILIKQ